MRRTFTSSRSLVATFMMGIAVFGIATLGCGDSKSPAKSGTANSGTTGGGSTATAPPTKFTLAWSEYPSWSIFGVADEVGLIDGKDSFTT